MTRTILRVRRPHHALLGANIHHDSHSWAYAVQPQGTPIKSVRHDAFAPLLDQGQVGSCTGNAAVACAYRAPFYAPGAPLWPFSPDETGALSWYALNTQKDGFPGTYQPDDTGSDGLTASKVALEAGIITGYQMSGDLQSSLETLQDRPGITGIPWYGSMFDAPSSGLLTVDRSSGLQGGHELCVDEVVGPDAPDNGTGKTLVGGPNSWGTGWGNWGRWYLTADAWWELRKEQGDVYFWTAKSQPAPTPAPEPVDSRDTDLWTIAEDWAESPHVGHTRHVASALTAWARLKGLA